VYRDPQFLIASTWRGKKRFPANRIAYAQTGPLKVGVESSGGKTVALRTWQTRTVADYINKQVNQTVAPERHVPTQRQPEVEAKGSVLQPGDEETRSHG
jgi:hypothetical protein